MAAEVPTGTVTFLFTDVEGSTTRWEADRDAMAGAVARHDELVTKLVAEHHGYVFSTAGDSFAVAFTRVGDAIDAAVAVQVALDLEPWPDGADISVRIGLHTGEADERDGDYFGPAVNRASRVMDAGHGGQILLSEATASLAVDRTTIDLGQHLLKSIEEPVTLHQLAAEGLGRDFPPVRSAGTQASLLPTTLGRLVGRDDELAKLHTLLADHRLITLTGTGGCGKTRLAVETGRRMTASTPGGVFFADLGPVGDDSLVAAAIATGLGAQLSETGDHVDQLVRLVGDRAAIVIVDNCEHVIDRTAEIIERLIGACPRLRLIATSREILELDGERTMRVSSLDADAAVDLFVDRAGEHLASVSTDDRAVIADICERLDRLPLAIELAAARTAVVPVTDIVEHLADRFGFLTAGRRRTRGRQQTLLATVEWSYDLLDPSEQQALRALSVMPSSFGLRLAAGVVGVGHAAAIDLLTSLSARSLVQTQPDEPSPHDRYRLLETIRVFAADRLRAAGEADQVRRRHAETVAAMTRPDGPFATLDDAHFGDDCLAAVAWAQATEDHELGTGLVNTAADILQSRGDLDEAIALYEWAAQTDDAQRRAQMWSHASWAAMLAMRMDDVVAHAGRAIEAGPDSLWEALGRTSRAVAAGPFPAYPVEDELDRARVLLARDAPVYWQLFEPWVAGGRALWMERDDDAIACFERAVGLASECGIWQIPARSALLHALFLVRDGERLGCVLDRPKPPPAQLVVESKWSPALASADGMALAALGRVGEGRRVIAEAWETVRGSVIPGLDGEVLVALAACCMVTEELDAARVLLDDTAWLCRQADTTAHMYRMVSQLEGVARSEALEWRAAEVMRRRSLSGQIVDEQRAGRAVDAELARLGLA